MTEKNIYFFANYDRFILVYLFDVNFYLPLDLFSFSDAESDIQILSEFMSFKFQGISSYDLFG